MSHRHLTKIKIKLKAEQNKRHQNLTKIVTLN